MPRFISNGLSLFYEEYNSEAEKTVVFVHPAPLDRLAWIYQIPYFAQFYRVIALDQRCFGLSDKPTFEFDISEYGRDLESLFYELNLKASIVVGLSLGGIAAQFLAMFNPSLVKALVLADTLSATRNSAMIIQRVKRFREEGISYYEDAVRSLCSNTYLHTDTGKYFLNLFVERSRNLSVASVSRCYEALSKLDITEKLSSIRIPTLVIAGTEDYAFADSKLISDKIPDAQFAPLEGLGHVTQLEAPASFNSLVLDFIKSSAA
ncbi:MAG: alpha/beta fold hydrolase [Nitrososphaerota archaeon]|nr:alpha/beta fold hydrolase [Nitrososphaerota archaeon]